MKRAAAILLAITTPAAADSALPAAPLADRQLRDPVAEAKARALMETIRCLVCAGQSVADSDAELAGDMRALIRTRIAAGETPDAVRAWLIARYGDHISYAPVANARTWPLFVGPVLIGAIGVAIAARRFRRQRG